MAERPPPPPQADEQPQWDDAVDLTKIIMYEGDPAVADTFKALQKAFMEQQQEEKQHEAEGKRRRGPRKGIPRPFIMRAEVYRIYLGMGGKEVKSMTTFGFALEAEAARCFPVAAAAAAASGVRLVQPFHRHPVHGGLNNALLGFLQRGTDPKHFCQPAVCKQLSRLSGLAHLTIATLRNQIRIKPLSHTNPQTAPVPLPPTFAPAAMAVVPAPPTFQQSQVC